MHGLHLERFIKDTNIQSTDLLQELENLANGEDIHKLPTNLQEVVTKYDLNLEETFNWKIGKTAI